MEKLIPTFIYNIEDPALFNKIRLLKKVGFVAVALGLVCLIIGEGYDLSNIECLGD